MATIKAGDFIKSTLGQLKRATSTINQIKTSKDFIVNYKTSEFDSVTTADLMSQYILETKYSEIYPEIKIFGEEAPSDLIPSDISDLDPYANNFPDSDFNNNEYPLEDCAIWIDPVDGTHEFVTGKLDEVTVLIALAVKGIPEIGIIAKIWEKDEITNENLNEELDKNMYRFDPSYYFAISGVEKVSKVKFVAENEVKFVGEFGKFSEREENKVYEGLGIGDMEKDVFGMKKMYFDTSSLCKRDDENKLLEVMGNPDIYRVGGAGNKVLRMIEGETDGYFYNHSGFAKWDTAPCDVMVGCLGGYTSGQLGKIYKYDGSDSNKDEQGCIAVTNEIVWRKMVEAFKEYYSSEETLKLLY